MAGNSNLTQTIRGNITATATLTASTTGGATPYHYVSAGSANQDSQNIKASAGTLYAITAYCPQSAIRYLKLYDKASAPTSADTPIFTHMIPGNASGAGTNPSLPSFGVALNNGLGIRITTGPTDGDAGAAAANDVVVDITYK